MRYVLLLATLIIGIIATPLCAASGSSEFGSFLTFQEDTLDSIVVGDTCAYFEGETLFVPVYIRNPVHAIGGFEVKLTCYNPYDPYIIGYGIAGAETVWIDTTGSCASHFEYFVGNGDASGHYWVKAVGIYDQAMVPGHPDPLFPCDTFRLLFKVCVTVDSPVISEDTTYDTLAHLHLDVSETRICDTTGLYLYYPGRRDGHLQIGGWRFVRGDANCDGAVTVVDASHFLSHLMPFPEFRCLDAADFDDNGALNIVDAGFLLSHLMPVPNLPPPYPDCAPDPTPDGMMCCTYPPCWWFKSVKNAKEGEKGGEVK